MGFGYHLLYDLSPCTCYPLLHHPPEQNGRHFADYIFKRIFTNEKLCIIIRISLKFVPKGLINNKAAFIQIMAWHRIGRKTLKHSRAKSRFFKFLWHILRTTHRHSVVSTFYSQVRWILTILESVLYKRHIIIIYYHIATMQTQTMPTVCTLLYYVTGPIYPIIQGYFTGTEQSGISPKVVALFSATNFSSYILELLQLHDKIQIKLN